MLTKPTRADAELVLKIYATMRRDDDFKRAHQWFWEEFDVKSYRAFKKKYPWGSMGNRHFNTIVGYWEVIATLVTNDLLSEDLVFDMLFVPWQKAEPIIRGIRQETKSPRFYENLEVLAKFDAREKKHPPKV